MRVYTKILMASLPLVLSSLLVGAGLVYFLSHQALEALATNWLEAKLSEAARTAMEYDALLRSYGLESEPASVKQAQADAGAQIGSLGIGERGYTAVISADGEVVAHTDPREIGRAVGGAGWFHDMSRHDRGRLILAGRGGTQLVLYEYFSNWKWYLVVADPEEDVYRPINRLGSYLLVLTAVSAVALALILAFLTRRLTAPLRLLAAGAETIGNGVMDVRIPIDSRDEVGDLARTFNGMVVRLRETLETLRRERDLNERITETSPVGIVVVDADGRISIANSRAEQLLGLDRSQIAERVYNAPAWHITDLAGGPFPDEELPFHRVMATRRPVFDVQHAIEWPGGRRVFLSISGAPLLGEAGLVERVVLALQDITERIRVEETLRRSEAETTILNRIAGVFLTNPDEEMYGKVLSVVLQAMDSRFGVFGYIGEGGELIVPSLTREIWNKCQVSGKSTVFPPDSWGSSLWGRAIREKRALRSDGPFHTPEGHVAIEHFLAVPLVYGRESIGLISLANKEGGYTPQDQELLERIAGSISPILKARLQRDIQERKRGRAEEEISKLLRAIEQSPASIIITDTAGNIEYVNPKFTEVTGYTSKDALGRNPRILKSGEVAADQYRAMWQAITSGMQWNGEFLNRRRNGEKYWARAAVSPILDASGAITHYLAVEEDITERKRLEEDRRQANRMEAFGQLAGGVAHDFNNILTVILGNVTLARAAEGGSTDRDAALEEIERAATRAAGLIGQLLTFGRRQAVQLWDLDLNDVVASMTKMLERIIGEHISLTENASPGGAPVHADPGMMEQVLMNLVVNARDAMPKGGSLRIETEVVRLDPETAGARPHARPGAFVRLSVSDTGCGIPAEQITRIFEPFFTTKEPGKGTGLGLATVFSIVELHDGWIEVESRVGAGTTFRVHLPYVPRKAAAGVAEAAARTERGGTETILLVEDEPALRLLARTILERHGYRILEAASGVEAVRVWERHGEEVNLLVTDMVMPEGMTGRELAKRLLAEKPSLKVIYSSGYTDEMMEDGTALRSAPNFLAKPYSTAAMLRKVRECLEAP